jgi:hypothetical protein
MAIRVKWHSGVAGIGARVANSNAHQLIAEQVTQERGGGRMLDQPPDGRTSRPLDSVRVPLLVRVGRVPELDRVHRLAQLTDLLWIKQPRKQGVSLKLKLFDALGNAKGRSAP